MSTSEVIAAWIYLGSLGSLSFFGLHRYFLTRIFLRSGPLLRDSAPPVEELPTVTVQLPVFNERYVVERLIDAAAALRWPASRLEIQVLDDSTDDTTAIAERAVERARACGIAASVIRRLDRAGFKAGALEVGLSQAKGEFVAVFDADFLPQPDFLERVMPQFAEGVGMVQARWGHLNRAESLLTRTQAVLLDGHFVVEHTARNRSGRFFNFNGTAGVWRAACIIDAGGWQHDTLTEDLDLSYRAQLKGWRFVYLPDVVAPGELPGDIGAFKSQQRRWAKGSIQTAIKLLPQIIRSPLPAPVRLEALAHLSANLAYPLMLTLSLVIPPSMALRERWSGAVGLADAAAFVLSSATVAAFYAVSQRAVYPDWAPRAALIPAVMTLGIGMGVNQTVAVIEALMGRTSPFVRTPKTGGRQSPGAYALAADWTSGVEILLCLYHLWGVGLALQLGYYPALPFQLLFCLGFGYVGFGSLLERLRRAGAGG